MHGLVNRVIQLFITDTYGFARWQDVAREADVGIFDFESMLQYPHDVTGRLLTSAEENLLKPRLVLLDDMGTYLVSHPNVEPLRRLLRFGGSDYLEFLFSLEELPGRARLALPDLHLPEMTVEEVSPNVFLLYVDAWLDGFSQVVAGILRAVADDYGALVFVEPIEATEQDMPRDKLQITLVEADYAQGRSFELGAAP